MLSDKQLELLEVRNWKDIKGSFKQADLLLGNGFSIGICPDFNYKSLFGCFLKTCDEATRKKFEAFGTTNFEFIMNELKAAQRVNTIFNIPCGQLAGPNKALKEGLIKTVEHVHPRCGEVDSGKLLRASKALDCFGDVYTLNYDALFYKIIMITNERNRLNGSVKPFNDYFWSHYDTHYLEFKDYQNYSEFKHVYYLHGALFIFRTDSAHLKIKRTASRELISEVSAQIEKGNFPLFVSEGTPEDKLRTIESSRYLTFSLDNLRGSEEPIVIYGASLSEPDKHIREAISRPFGKPNKTKRIAYAIYVGDKTEEDIQEEIANIKSYFPHQEVVCYNASTLFNF